jgi:hypothetical protein
MIEQDLRNHFEVGFALPPTAVNWLLDLWHVTQVFDDVADKDKIKRSDLDRAIFASLVQMPSNPFFLANASQLMPVLACAMLKWKASDDAEREGKADAKSFVWRAAYYDVVLMVVLLCHGSEVGINSAKNVMALYGETFESYCKEYIHG